MSAYVDERERLARKVRALVARAYKRAQDRQQLRDAGFEVPDSEPGSWEEYEDAIFKTFKPKVERARHLHLVGGLGEGTPAGGLAAAGATEGQSSRHGPSAAPGSSRGARGAGPTNFDTEETSA